MNPRGSAVQSCWDVPRLLQQFESLGENCDLGVVQRAVGIEPFGLFRFSACDAPGVLALLRNRLQPLGEPQDLWLDTVGPQREYWVKSRNSGFESHTNRYAAQHERGVVRQGEIDRIRYLKSHLLQDLSGARKLFVFKGRSELPLLRAMAAAVQDYGPNCLLWVDVADRGRTPGTVERDSASLLRGFVSRFGTYDGAPSLPVEEWASVCAGAWRLWRNEDPPRTQVDNLIAGATAAGTSRWSEVPEMAARTADDSSSAHELTFEHCLRSGTPAVAGHVHLPIERGGDFVFSAWVRIHERCGPGRISLILSGFPTVLSWPVDLKSRGTWQRAWVSARLPEDAHVVACELHAEGGSGGTFESARWCLERGAHPCGYGFSL